MNGRRANMALLALAVAATSGCSIGPDTTYGRLRGQSVNGTGVLAALLRARGHEVRAAVRLTDELSEWADVIVRLAPYPGPPEREEAEWYARWLDAEPDRDLIYIPYDYSALADYWSEVLAHLPQTAPTSERTRAEKLRDRARSWADRLPPRPKDVAGATEWFAVVPATTPPKSCRSLDGPWAEDIDPAQAAISEHETLKVDAETVLLQSGGKDKDKKTLAMEWTIENGSRVLVLANGSFLLNAALLNPARRPLADRVVDWLEGNSRHIAFVEGRYVLGSGPAYPSIWGILERVPSIRWVAIHLLVLGLVACLARAPRLGRPRPEPPSGADRPAAHAEALGALLQRTRQESDARSILDAYRRWRYPSRSGARATTAPLTAEPPLKLTSEIEFLDT